jgi:hypothetical protein
MSDTLIEKLRTLGNELCANHQERQSCTVYTAVYTIESMDREIKELKGMLEDAEHFRDYWFDRTLEMRKHLRAS